MPNLIFSTLAPQDPMWKTLTEFSLPSQPGSDRLAQQQAAAAVQKMNLPLTTMERLKTAVAEAILNAIERSHRYQPDLSVFIRILVLEQNAPVGGIGQDNEPGLNVQTLEPRSKTSEGLAQRGWGFFLIHKLSEELTHPEEVHYSLELFLYQEDDLG